jgi:hypothetical protein
MLIIDNEFRNLISPLTKEEFEQLENNIISEGGIHDPIIIWNNIIIDGHNRYDICIKNDLKYFTKELELTDRNQAINWIIDNQLGRRNLAPWQQSILRGKRYNAEKKPKGGDTTRAKYQNDTLLTRDTLATQYGVSPATIARDGNFAIAAEKASELEDVPVMKLSKSKILEVAKEIQQEKRDERRAERIEKLVEITENNKPLELFEDIVIWCSNKGDTVFDPYMGSGTTGVASLKNERNFIGIDNNSDYVAIAQERIRVAQMQPGLFNS